MVEQRHAMRAAETPSDEIGSLRMRSPNFLTLTSREAEYRVAQLLDRSSVLGVSRATIGLDTDDVVQVVSRYCPDRLNNVEAKVGNVAELDAETLMDKLLGVDFLLDYEGKRFAVDATVGKPSVVTNKLRKAEELSEVYTKLGIDFFIVASCSREIGDYEIGDDDVLRFVSGLDEVVQVDALTNDTIRGGSG